VTQVEQIAEDVARIRKDVDAVLHGNHRKGLWAISDAVFGPPGKDDDGLVKRMRALEDRNKETKFLQRGIAIGMGLVVADNVLGLNLSALVGRLFGQ
jgi:hypothetical protein